MYKVFQQTPYYLPLFGIFFFGFLGFFAFSYDRTFQTGVIVATGSAHVVWGIIYHYIHKDLSINVVLEYLVVASFGIAAVLTALG